MAVDENTTTTIDAGRIEAALHAAYEIESLTSEFPHFQVGDDVTLGEEYLYRLIVSRFADLARVVMSALDDDRETSDLRLIVGLSEVNNG